MLAVVVATWLLLHVHLATANDMYFRAKVLDCNNRPARGAYVSVYGCTDKAGSNNAATNAAESRIIEAVNPRTGVAGTPITQPMYCPAAWGALRSNGLRVDFCSTSAQNKCNIAVMKLGTSGNGTYYVPHPGYQPQLDVFRTDLQSHVRNTTDPTNCTAFLYQTTPNPSFSPNGGDRLWCPSPFIVCSFRVFKFKPKPAICNGTARVSQTTCSGQCPGLGHGYGSGKPVMVPRRQSGYAVMCALDKNASDGPASLAYPTFVAFNSRQPVYPSLPALFQDAKPNNWGWMGQWPKAFVAGGGKNCSTIRGRIYASRRFFAGTVAAVMKVYPPPAGSPAGTKQYRLTLAVNVRPNRLRQLHVYLGCTKLAANAPARFGNGWGRLKGVQRVTKTVRVVCFDAINPVLYTAIHVGLN